MTKANRERIASAAEQIAEIRETLEEIKEDEEEEFDSLPEKAQEGTQGEEMQAAIEILEEVIGQLEECEDSLSDIDP